MPGFLLGLSTGATCLAYCGPVLFPYLLGQGRGFGRSYLALSQFLAGRLSGYLLFAILAWGINRIILAEAGRGWRLCIQGAAFMILAVLMVWYGLRQPKAPCAGHTLLSGGGSDRNKSSLLPLMLGFLTGLNLCPPFLLAFTGAVGSGNILGSLLYFGSFFLGTSLYLLPAPLLGALGRWQSIRTVGRLAAAVVAVYYLFYGAITLTGGIINL